MRYHVALLDANILYSAPLRDLFLELAVTGLFGVRWSQEIHAEWTTALLRNHSGVTEEMVTRTCQKMDLSCENALVRGYSHLIEKLELPDPDDRHVLAAAIAGGCTGIVTQNLQDFPEEVVAKYHLEIWHPDRFLSSHVKLDPIGFCESVRNVRARLKKPPMSIDQYFENLRALGLPLTVAALEPYREQL